MCCFLFLLVFLILLFGVCCDGYSIGQGWLIGCYVDIFCVKELVKVVCENGVYVMLFCEGQFWWCVDILLGIVFDVQIVIWFSLEDVVGIDDILLMFDGFNGVVLFKLDVIFQGQVSVGNLVVIECGCLWLMVKKWCQWLFVCGYYFCYGG